VAEELRDDIFKPFKQVDNLANGDGLGLPICNLIAMKLNGSLSLDTSYKKGCRFVLELHS
jgi:C4-dicarboxylate-specific signal transduction histidine kinase